MEETISQIWKSIATLNDDYTALSSDVAVLKNQMAELLWWGRAMGIAVIGFMGQKILKSAFKNNKKK